MKSIYGITIHELEEFLLSIDEKKYRAAQIMDWLYVKRIDSFENDKQVVYNRQITKSSRTR